MKRKQINIKCESEIYLMEIDKIAIKILAKNQPIISRIWKG